jgi:hypothetical protein
MGKPTQRACLELLEQSYGCGQSSHSFARPFKPAAVPVAVCLLLKSLILQHTFSIQLPADIFAHNSNTVERPPHARRKTSHDTCSSGQAIQGRHDNAVAAVSGPPALSSSKQLRDLTPRYSPDSPICDEWTLTQLGSHWQTQHSHCCKANLMPTAADLSTAHCCLAAMQTSKHHR